MQLSLMPPDGAVAQCIVMVKLGINNMGFDGNKNRKNKIIYLVIVVWIVLLCLFFSYFNHLLTGPTVRETIIENDLSESFSGIVEKLYYDKENHNIKVAVLKGGYKFQIFRQWEREISVGDSLFKKRDSFLLEIYKKSKQKTILDYRRTIKE